MSNLETQLSGDFFSKTIPEGRNATGMSQTYSFKTEDHPGKEHI